MIFFLAEKLGKTVGELENTMSAKEFKEWFVYLTLDSHKAAIEEKEMTDDDRSQAIISGFMGL